MEADHRLLVCQTDMDGGDARPGCHGTLNGVDTGLTRHALHLHHDGLGSSLTPGGHGGFEAHVGDGLGQGEGGGEGGVQHHQGLPPLQGHGDVVHARQLAHRVLDAVYAGLTRHALHADGRAGRAIVATLH